MSTELRFTHTLCIHVYRAWHFLTSVSIVLINHHTHLVSLTSWWASERALFIGVHVSAFACLNLLLCNHINSSVFVCTYIIQRVVFYGMAWDRAIAQVAVCLLIKFQALCESARVQTQCAEWQWLEPSISILIGIMAQKLASMHTLLSYSWACYCQWHTHARSIHTHIEWDPHQIYFCFYQFCLLHRINFLLLYVRCLFTRAHVAWP